MLILIRGDHDHDTALAVLNSFHDSILVTHETAEVDPSSTTFLDLDIEIGTKEFAYRTHRKPMNTFAYVPASSAHPVAVKEAIIATETIRLLRTNSAEDTFAAECLLFLNKLKLRGYSIQRAREIMQRYTWQCKHDILHKKHATEGNKPRVVPFKVPYSDGMATLNIGRIIQHHVGLLVNPLRDFLKPLVCYTSGCSLFRKRYNRFR